MHCIKCVDTEKKYSVFMGELISSDFFKKQVVGKINLYTCDCGHVTKSKDVDIGVTPFMINCIVCKNA